MRNIIGHKHGWIEFRSSKETISLPVHKAKDTFAYCIIHTKLCIASTAALAPCALFRQCIIIARNRFNRRDIYRLSKLRTVRPFHGKYSLLQFFHKSPCDRRIIPMNMIHHGQEWKNTFFSLARAKFVVRSWLSTVNVGVLKCTKLMNSSANGHMPPQ